MTNQDASVFFTMIQWPGRSEIWSPAARKRAAELGFHVRLHERDTNPTPDEWARAIEGVDALITGWGAPRLDETILARNTTLKIVGHAAGSVGGIVSPALYERGVRVVTSNAIMAEAVAEWCLLVTQLGWQRFLDYAGLGQLTDMRWDNRLLVRSMHEATIAIWGYGDISQRLIALMRPLQPKEILLHSGHLTPEQAAQVGVTLVPFDELFERGDIIHLLGAMTDRNAGKVGPKQLAAIRDNAVLINAGRARLVQEEALLAEVRKQRFLTILDVHYKEPVPADSPFRGMPNVILTPHVAGRGKEGLYIPHVLEEFDRFFRGEPLISEVTQERALGMTDESKAHKRT